MDLAALLAAQVDIATLTDEALVERLEALREAMRAAREGVITADVTALMEAAKEQVGALKVERTERAEAAAQLIAEADAALEGIDDDETEAEAEGEEGEGDGEGDGAEGTETEAGDGADGATEATEATEGGDAPAAEGGEALPIAAANDKVRRNVKVPARAKPRAKAGAGPRMIATSEVRGVAPGHQFSNLAEMDEAMFDRWVAMRASADGRPHYMSTIDYRHLYPEEQRLTNGDPFGISDKIMAHVERRNGEMKEMVASGGVPGPAEPRYGQITYGQANRPLRDGLPAFLAQRGEIVFNGSPTLADIVLDTALGAIGTVTSSQDASGATKDIQEISAPTPTTVTVEAETMRFSQGNFADRFYPERTRAFLALGQVAYARHNDALRLTDIKNNCTKFTDTPAKFGAYRDLKRQFQGQLEELEDLTRDFNLPVRVLLPEYVPAMLAADMEAQQPGDGTWNWTEERMRADIESWDPNVNITWLADSIRGRLSTSPSGQSPRSAGFDADVEWAMFPEGAFIFLDGGQLDLGIIRDTVVSATNKFQTFFESWEALAPLISSTLCFWMTSSLCSDGASQIATNIAVCSPQGS